MTIVWSGELGYVGPDRISRMLAAHLDDVATPVLDVGCGTGLTSVHLAEQGFRAIDGIDITPAMLERAKGTWHLPQLDPRRPQRAA